MKANMLIITLSAAASLLNVPVSRAQEPAPAPAGSSQTQDAIRAVQEKVVSAQAEAQNAQAQAQKAQAEAQENLVKARLQAKRAEEDMAQASAQSGGGGFGGYSASGTPVFQQRLQNIIKRGPDQRAGRTLVVCSSESDLKQQSKLEEDLAVMSHILEKAASERAGGHGGMAWGGTAMGIDVLYSPTASPLRTLYLEGYGALFLLNVGFPVLPPPQAEDQQEKTDTNSDWEDAKQELYGQDGGGRIMAVPSEPYDKERVSRLREGLLESLKNATNIRDLKPDDSITVCVFGGPSSGQAKPKEIVVKRGTRDEIGAVFLAGSPMRQTIMTIRVKKSDADAFAKGTITLDGLRKRAHIVSYAGSPEASMSFGGGTMGGGMMGGFGGGSGGRGAGFGGGGGGGVMRKP